MVGDSFEWGWLLVSDSFEAADLVVSKLMKVNLKRITHYKKVYLAGLVPEFDKIELNRDIKPFVSERFYLKRDLWNYLALVAWLHPWINHFFYESCAADLLHRIMYTFRKRPISD